MNTRRRKKTNLEVLIRPKSSTSEQFREIYTNIKLSLKSDEEELRTIGITSSGSGEGKSTIISNLAVIFAIMGERVLLIDGDLRKPKIAEKFGVSNNNDGLSTLLTSKKKFNEVVIKISDVVNLSILTSGPIPPDPVRLLSSRKFDQILMEFIEQYDVVLFDLPPLGILADSNILASKLDGMLLVIRDHVTKKASLLRAKELLERSDANVIGWVYNDGYGYGYGYGYKKESRLKKLFGF
ncbi:MAG: CpsD/CapB family tyrosine-protein kinase [Lactobacillales bacterium]|jgi:capsular exopolysaccharide synthesis family protein|nr:CpsD/CapB family tyrosine-protein kinase [Lactobacillales bacterium]